MKRDGETGPRRPKSREIGSRYLSPSSVSSMEEIETSSANRRISMLKQKPRSSIDYRKQKSIDEGRLPPPPRPPSSSNQKQGRLKDRVIEDKVNKNAENSLFLNRQKSSTLFSRFEKNEKDEKKIAKDNKKTLFGGSMRYTGKFLFPSRSSNSQSNTSFYQTPNLADEIAPGRLSVDVNVLRRGSLGRSDSFSDNHDSESEFSDVSSNNRFDSSFTPKNPSLSYMNSTTSSRSSGVEVSSKFLHDLRAKTRRGTSESNTPNKLLSKSASKRADPVTASDGGLSKWASSPGRGWSPPKSVEKRGKPPSPFSNLRPRSPTKTKGVGDLLSKGLDLFRSRKSTAAAAAGGSAVGPGGGESAHQLRLMRNLLVQWRFANARGDAVNGSITNQAESDLLGAMNNLTRLQLSVVQKKLQLQKEKLEMKLNFILHSHIKSLEGWGDIEKQHISAVSRIIDSFHSVVCRVPLVEGAKMETHSAYFTIGHARELATSINSLLYNVSPKVEKTLKMLGELAEVVTQEKALLDEFLELLKIISTLQVQERSLKCSLIQIKLWHQQQEHEKLEKPVLGVSPLIQARQ